MHAIKEQPDFMATANEASGEKPLARSALGGEARLRELEHLAETARKVRDQAASELTRNSGSTHHVARERMAAAERMLRKTQLEIMQLQEQLSAGSIPRANQAKDFELAVMLGHSRARFNLENTSQYSLEEKAPTPRARTPKASSSKTNGRTSLWRVLSFGLFIAAGLGIGMPAFNGFLNTGTLEGAAEAVISQVTNLLSLPSESGYAAVLLR